MTRHQSIPPFVPTPKEIEDGCQRIRAGWEPDDTRLRTIERQRYQVPMIVVPDGVMVAVGEW